MSEPREILKLEKTLNEIAHTLYDLGDYQKAIRWYDKAIESNPDSPRTYLNKG
jgi:tetratricopeptide (TPR) repeat protein